MANLFINPDGANHQAQAVLAYLRQSSGIEDSWDDKAGKYLAEPRVDRWHNCREQGYVVQMRSRDYSRQLNIAFFEHRNSDSICAVRWEQTTTNPPTIDTMPTDNKFYKSKWDVSHSVGYGEPAKMAEWVLQELQQFWRSTLKDVEHSCVA
jgi:hypothetical protein